jgi:hypothetical protein
MAKDDEKKEPKTRDAEMAALTKLAVELDKLSKTMGGDAAVKRVLAYVAEKHGFTLTPTSFE